MPVETSLEKLTMNSSKLCCARCVCQLTSLDRALRCWQKNLRKLNLLQLISALILCAQLLTSSSNIFAQSFPELTGQVVDQAEILDEAQEDSLTQQLSVHESETSNQVVVVTVETLEGYDIAEYANLLGRQWEIGTADEDNGVVLLVAPNERKVRIEVGYGLEGALTDAQSSIIIQREILPAFSENDYPGGISKGIIAILQSINGEYVAPAQSTNRQSSGVQYTTGRVLPLIFIAMVAIIEILRRFGFRKAANSTFPTGFAGLFATIATGKILIGVAIAVAVFLFVYLNGKSRSRRTRRSGRLVEQAGMNGGFGGFRGGGGSFGGGGASGSW